MPFGLHMSNLPPGCGTLPGEEPEYEQPRCRYCGGFLRTAADREEPWEYKVLCPGWPNALAEELLLDPACGDSKPHPPHEYVEDYGSHEIRVCRRCKAENRS